jgi:uncharacterized membrane-anchored protein
MFLSANEYKKSNEGYLTMGRAMGITYLTGLFIAVLSNIYSLILTYFYGMNLLADQISFDPLSFKYILIANLSMFVFGCMSGAIVALIVSVIMKRNKPISFNSNYINNI